MYTRKVTFFYVENFDDGGEEDADSDFTMIYGGTMKIPAKVLYV